MKPKFRLSSLPTIIFTGVLATGSLHAQTTYIWDPTNVTGTPTPTLDWFSGGSNPLGLWTGAAVPLSDSNNTIQFFANNTTSLPNTAVPSTQTANLNNGGSAFQLGTLTLNGFGSATSGASLTMTLQGDALNFSGAAGTINFNSLKNVAPAVDPVVNYTINNNIQLGTAGSASALTLTGNGDNSGSTTYNIVGAISELQAGGGSIIKSGTSLVTISGAVNTTGAVTVSAGQLTLSNSTNTASSMTVNGGTLILTGNLNPASASMTVNSGGILRIGNNTATQFGPSGVYSGNISTGTGGTLQLWSSSNQTLSGIISGSGGINKANGGTLTLSNSNTYTGRSSFIPQNTTGFTQNVESFNSVFTNVGLGTVHSASSTLGAPTTVANGTIDVGGNAQASVTLNYTGSGETTDRVVAVAWNGNSTQTISTSGGGLLKFTSGFTAAGSGGTGSLVLGGAGNGEVNGITGSLNTTGLSKIGNGTWTISGASTFTQPTTVTAGILNLTSATALQNSPFNTASTLGTGSIGLRTTTTTLTLGGLTGANALKGRFTLATGGPSNATAQGGYDGLTNLTLNTAGTTSVYTGAIVDGAAGMSLTKTGAGIQTITSANTYTGTTFVNGGFLQLNGSTLTGGLSVSNATLASNSTFAGVSTVSSGGIISPGASSGAIGAITLTNNTASALTINGGTGIFDLPSTVTTPDQIAVTGGLVVSGTNTVLLRTPLAGTPAGVYNLITSSALSGAGTLVLANGSATRGNATISTSGGNVILTVAAGGLAGTTTYTGTSGAFNSDRWSITTNWSGGAVPTGTTNVVLPDQTAAFTVPVLGTAPTPSTYSGDLWIGNNVTLQVGSTTGNAAFNNAYGTPGSTIIYMGENSAISHRNSGNAPTLPQIVLLGNASMRFQESTQAAVNPNFANSISGPFTLTLNSGAGNGFSTHTLNAANSFAGLNLAGTSGVVNAAVSGSIGTANLTISGGGTVNLNHATALSGGTNPIRINNGTLAYGTTAAAPLTLSINTRPIELNGTGQGTIANNASSSANILTLNNSISSTASGAKTLTFGGTNTGLNLVTSALTDGTGGGSIGIAKTGVGTWQLSGNNSYTGATTISGGTLNIQHANALGATTAGTSITAANATLALQGGISYAAEALTLSNVGANNAAMLRNVSGDNTWNGNITTTGATAGSFTRIQSDAGTLTIAGSINSGALTNGTVVLQGASAINITGQITGAAPLTSGIINAGAGSIRTLSNASNNYTGITSVTGGTLVVGANAPSGSDGALGNATSEVSLGIANDNTNSSLLIGGAFTVGRVVRLATNNTTDTGTRVLTLGGNTAHNSEFSGNIFLGTASQAGRGVTLTAASGGQATFSGVIQNPSGMDATTYTVTKSGSGAVVLSNANTYTGATSVSEGTLLVNNTTGSGTGTGAVTVASGATLGGTGAISGTVNVTGVLSPGASIQSLQTGALTMNSGSSFVYEVADNTATGADLLGVNGSLSLSNVTLSLDSASLLALGAATWNVGDRLTLISYTGTAITSGFTDGVTAYTDGTNYNFGGNLWTFNYDDTANGLNFVGDHTAGNRVTLTAFTVVPEPSSVALLGVLGSMLLLRRRR